MQARPSDGLGQLAHSTPAPHRRCSAVSPRTRQRGTTPFRFPIRVRRSMCCPTMTTADAIVTMLVPSPFRIGTSLCPRCFRCVSSSCPNSLHMHAMYVPLNAYSQATQGARMVHAHLTQTITQRIRTFRALATVPATHSIRDFRATETPLIVHKPAWGFPSYAVGLQIGRCTPCVHKAIFCTQHPRCVRGISADFTSKLWRMSAPLPCREHIVNAVEPL